MTTKKNLTLQRVSRIDPDVQVVSIFYKGIYQASLSITKTWTQNISIKVNRNGKEVLLETIGKVKTRA